MKVGEIVFDSEGYFKQINGYDGDRKSFEFIELSEYYIIMDFLEFLLKENEKQNESLRREVENLMERVNNEGL